jgi:hypothetical protein
MERTNYQGTDLLIGLELERYYQSRRENEQRTESVVDRLLRAEVNTIVTLTTIELRFAINSDNARQAITQNKLQLQIITDMVDGITEVFNSITDKQLQNSISRLVIEPVQNDSIEINKMVEMLLHDDFKTRFSNLTNIIYYNRDNQENNSTFRSLQDVLGTSYLVREYQHFNMGVPPEIQVNQNPLHKQPDMIKLDKTRGDDDEPRGDD